MTSATSLNKKNRLLSFFTFTLRKQTPITLLITAFCLLICPGVLLNNVLEDLSHFDALSSRLPEMEHYFVDYSIAIFIVALALMLILTVWNFSYLYSKKAGDVFHALPLRRVELLSIRMLSSFVGAAFTMTVSFASLTMVNFMPRVIGLPFATILATYGAMITMLFMLTVFTTIFAVCSGGIFDFIIAICSINCGLPALYYVFLNFLENNSYGVIWQNELEIGIYYTSPFLFGAAHVIKLAENGIEGVKETFLTIHSPVNVFTMVLYVIFTALCILAVLKLYSVRRSETAGESYSFSLVPHIISVIVSIAGGYLLGYIFTGYGFDDISFWLFFIIGIVLCSITAGAIFSRGFKTIVKSMIRSAITLGVAISICIGLLFYGGYAERYIPDADEIDHIAVGYDEQVVFEGNFDIVTDIHNAVLNKVGSEDTWEKEEAEIFVDQFDSIRMSYYLKNGKVVEREYYGLVSSEYDEYFIRYAKSDEYLKQFTDFDVVGVNAELDLNDYSLDTGNWKERQLAAAAPATVKKLLSVYAAEVKAAEKAVLYEPCDVLSVNLYGEAYDKYISSIRIPESFKQTRAILAEIDFMSENDFYNKD